MQSKLLAYVLILVVCLDGAEGINLPNLKALKLPNLVRTNVLQHSNSGAAAKSLQCKHNALPSQGSNPFATGLTVM